MARERIMQVNVVPGGNDIVSYQTRNVAGLVRFRKGVRRTIADDTILPHGTLREPLAVTVVRGGRIGRRSFVAEPGSMTVLAHGDGGTPNKAITDMFEQLAVARAGIEASRTEPSGEDSLLRDVKIAVDLYDTTFKKDPRDPKKK